MDPKFYAAYMAWTKESFAILVTTITQFWSPTLIRVSGDESMQGQLYQMPDGSLKCNFPHRLVLMANHQLYTDWLYLWWIAYTNKMHGHIYIILKESLKSLPILGWGAQFYNFIFLSRKWETDKTRFKSALNCLKSARRPMWLLIFPEGTNLSAVTRETSAAWAKKSGLQDMKHQLLPRTTGLQFCLQELRGTTNWLYDCTIAYEGIPNGMYGQDIFTLRSSFFEGRPPKSVNMFWRRFKLADIPLDNDEAFARWLNNRWREKDYILEYFYKYNQFPDEAPQQALAAARGQKKAKHAKAICTEVKGEGWQEFLSIFGPLTTAAGALSAVDLTEPLNIDALLAQLAKQQTVNFPLLNQQTLVDAGEQAVRNALMAAQRSNALPQPVLKYLLQVAPKSQEEMKQALLASVAALPTSAATAPAVHQKAAGNAAKGSANTIKLPARRKSSAAAASDIQKRRPLANVESAVTRPLTTAAVQTAAASIQKAAAAAAAQNKSGVDKQTEVPGSKKNVPKRQASSTSKVDVRT